MSSPTFSAHATDPAGGLRTSRAFATAISRCPVCSPRRDLRAKRNELLNALERKLAALDARDAALAALETEWRAERVHRFPTVEDATRIIKGAWRV